MKVTPQTDQQLIYLLSSRVSFAQEYALEKDSRTVCTLVSFRSEHALMSRLDDISYPLPAMVLVDQGELDEKLFELPKLRMRHASRLSKLPILLISRKSPEMMRRPIPEYFSGSVSSLEDIYEILESLTRLSSSIRTINGN